MFNNTVLILPIAFFIILAGLFAGSETGMYRLSRLRLRLGVERKKLSYVILSRCLHDSSGLLLSMLIGTNLAHYLTTSFITYAFFTYVFLSKTGAEHNAELFATLLTAPTLFVFSELIPKNIFFYRSDSLMPYLSPLLYSFHKVLSWCGVIPLLKFISGLFVRLSGLASSSKTVITSAQRHQVQAILQDTHEEGILSAVQTDIINRLVSISHINIRSVMVPINNVQMVDVNSDNTVLLNKLEECAYTRLLVTEGEPGHIIGFISIYEALSLSEQFTDLTKFVKPIRKIDANITVIEAINIMQRENQKIVLVTRGGRPGRERPIGIVTMKDLVEELLGELAEW
ncbi:MAG TPA: CNNM domain-containing protein [Sedimentisphaerales bacterium]|nr:CNNM domain-containing protein [Sedimentisphaerales bacterium]